MVQEYRADMNYSIRRVFLFISLMLLTVVQAWAGTINTNDISIEVLPNNSGNGVEVISAVPNGDMTKVTIKVTKTGTYTINENLITVVPMVKLPQQARRRAPGFAGSLPVYPVTGEADQYYFEISHVDYDGAYVTARFVESTSTTIYSLSEITNLNGQYTLGADISGGEVPAAVKTGFTGSLNGNYHKIYNLSEPLFESTTSGAKIYNLMLEDVSISESGNVGAITRVANGATRIYNCGILSGSVSGSEKVGGLVGLLDGTSRVINCFSYADVLGGTDKGGIVGYNNYASKNDDIKTMIMNCMFYGNISSGGNISPVYGGELIDNLQEYNGLNTFNYYRYESDYSKNGNITTGKYNCALAVEEEYLTRVEIYRQLLNSNRKLAAWYVFNDASKGYGKDNEMAKWVLETADQTNSNPKPYPILKAQGYYHSIVNYDAENAPQTPENIKSLTINVGSSPLRITDKDPDHYNFNYHKVQLPYYDGDDNYKIENNVYKVVTGWEVTVGGDTQAIAGTDISSNGDKPYNYADRKCTYDENNKKRVYSQGAYFDVPEGVSSITLTPHWATAVFVADPKLDKVYKKDYNLVKIDNVYPPSADVIGDGYTSSTTFKYGDGTVTVPVYTNIATAISKLPTATSVYDNAVVLVGNLHLTATPSTGTKPFTIMSADFDKDHEPDFSLIYTHARRADGAVSPIRFDFLNMPGMAMAQKPNGSDVLRNVSIFKPKGWFEVTNTCLVHFVQFEYDDGSKTAAPVILLGGVYDQFVSTQSSKLYNESTKQPNTKYIHVGSNAWFKEFGNGTHSDGWQFTPHIPISVTGGDYQKFYLSGTYRPDAIVMEDNAECYISGGRFGELAGAGQQQIDGDVNWFIDYADIDEFYGGGINAGKPITGDITIDIKKSNVKFFCGGPKFGDMQKKGTIDFTWGLNIEGDKTGSRSKEIDKDREVTTDAEKCTFGNFYGAGYGGNSYYRVRTVDHSQTQGIDWNSWQSAYINDRGKYITNNNGIPTDFDYEYFIGSDGVIWGRFYVQNASFSMAQTNNVTSTLNECIVTGDYYGGGCRGRVDGKATSTLIDCTVNGNVFGGGYSASVPTISVRSSGFTTIPSFNSDAGVFNDGVFSASSDFTWKRGTLTDGSTALSGTNITTDVDLSSLGQVKETDLKIQGNTTVGGLIDGSPTGGVFGGGDASAVYENTKVTITKGEDNTIPTIPNVFGGGNKAGVFQNTEVKLENGNISDGVYGGCNTIGTIGGDVTMNLEGGTVAHNVFGGGKGQPTLVNGNVSVNVGKMNGTTPEGGTIGGDVYGGSALGNVNAIISDAGVLNYSGSATTQVNLIGGTISGSLYGGGLGDLASLGEGHSDVAANVYGPVTVTVEGGNVTDVYGCNNFNGSPQQDVIVNIAGGTINNNVFGGGHQADALGNITVNVTGGTVTNDVYGGGALADTNTANWDDTNSKFLYFEVTGLTVGTSPVIGYYTKIGDNYTLTSDTKAKDGITYYSHYTTTVNLTGGTVGNAYGGALGSNEKAANVWGDVYLTVDGTAFTISNDSYTEGAGDNVTTVQVPKSGRVFGCNNINGTPKRDVTVHVKQTVPSGGGDHTLGSYEIAAVYGGGNLAPYEPKKAETESTVDGDDFSSDDTKASTNVIIDGCDATSIETVYGGGNAASTPSTKVTVNGAFEIGELFGGGNGKDKIKDGENWLDNPGAHVGFKAYAINATEAQKNAAKYGSGQARVNIYGGKIHAVYGGSNTLGNVRRVAVAMLDEVVSTCPIAVDEAYGGGKSADMDGKAILNLGCIPGIGSVYGGARAAKVNNDVELTITNGTYTNVFGGNNERNVINGKITVNIEETGCRPIRITNLYGGGNLAAYPGSGATIADPSVTLNVKSFTEIGNIYGGGYGEGADVTSDVTVNINEVKGRWSKANTPTPTNTYNETGASNLGVIGNVYGGGYGADVIGDVEVNIGTEETVDFVTEPTYLGSGNYTYDSTEKLYKGVTVEGANITGNIYGGGYGANTTVTGDVEVNIGGEKTEGEGSSATTTFIGGNITIGESVYGGSALGVVNATTTKNNAGVITAYSATANATTKVTLKNGTITGAVYGGGMGKLPTNSTSNDGVNAKVYGDATVTLYGEVVAGGIYGGCNLNGAMKGDVQLDLLGGRVGAEFTATTVPAEIPNIVFGGGLGALTTVEGDVTVNVNKSDKTPDGVAIYSNVYGGSKNGSVGKADVNLLGGVIWGDVFGGGYSTAEGKTAATNVTVTLNGTAFGITYEKDDTNKDVPKTGRVFGCNNLQGSPTGDVTVNVEKTTDLDADHAKTASGKLTSTTPSDHYYNVQAVYGGGNLAAYAPTTTGAKSQVNIRGCNDTSIEYVYGGGNAASMPATNLNVEGAYEIGYTFGGGNGSDRIKNVSGNTVTWTENPGANVNGNAISTLVGGFIHNVFGGSNTKGTITGEAKIDIDKNGSSCQLITENIYGAGMNADMEGDVNLRIGCLDSNVKNVYGGAMAAKINGNVTLTITSGTLENVYGGNNQSGSISGKITVNIEEVDECQPIVIGNLYGGGNMAPYPGPYFTNNNPSIEVNVKSFTSIGNVYGGGRGETAIVTGNTIVNINEVKGRWASTDREAQTLTINGVQVTIPEHKANEIGAIGNVYGSGDAAAVDGNTTVNIGTVETVDFVIEPSYLGTGKYTYDSGTKLYKGVSVEGAKITGNVYGGGNLADVTGNTEVNICASYNATSENWESVSAGSDVTSDVTIEGNVYGGGKGVAKMTVGNPGDAYECKKAMVGIDGEGVDAQNNPKDGGTTVRIFNGTVGILENGTLKDGTGNVYGGGEVGRVERNSIVTIGKQDDDSSQPNIQGYVFGGGAGVKTHGYSALVRGNSSVTVQGGATVGKSVYGGGQIATVGRYTVVDGLPTTTTSGGVCTVIIRDNATINENVFGAGKGTLPYEDCNSGDVPQHMNGTKHMVNVEGTPTWNGTWDDVLVNYPAYNPNDYDQNKPAYAAYLKFIKTLALVSDTEVTITGDAKVYGSVYGGSESGYVQQDTQVTIQGSCEIGTTSANANIFGGGLGSGVFAEAGIVRGNTEVYVNGGTTNGTVYGGGSLGNVKGTTEVNVYANKVNNGYEVVTKGSEPGIITGNVFGGGKGLQDTFTCEKAMVGVDGDGIEHPEGGTTVRVFNGTVNGSVYGGGEVGRVEKNTVVTIGSGNGGDNTSKPNIKGDVFGAGAGVNTHGFSALVRGNSTVTVEGDAQIGESVYGGGQIATVGRYIVINSLPSKPASGGLCTVNIQGHAIIGTDSEGNVFGAGKGVMPENSGSPWSMASDGSSIPYTLNSDTYFTFIQTLGLASDTEVTVGGNASVTGSVYGGSENGFVQRHTQVTIQGSCEVGTNDGTSDVDGDIYGGGRGDDSVTGYSEAGKVKGNTTVNINGGTMHGSVYGGGEKGYTVGSANVNMAGGTVYHDVYGGGALANTNVGNGDDEHGFVEVLGLTAGTSSVEGLYENTYVNTSDTEALANKTYYTQSGSEVIVLAVGAPLEGLGTLYEEGRTQTEDEVAAAYKMYYNQSGVLVFITAGTNIENTSLQEWSESHYVPSTSSTAIAGKRYYTVTHPTTVDLTGGEINGDAYGGGLGQKDGFNGKTGNIPAVVYGDISVNLGSSTSGSSATAFNISNYTGDYSSVVKSGRVFGCNNLLGSPRGDVRVTVYKTVAGNVSRTAHEQNNEQRPQTGTGVTPTYEVAGVYGGGNLADFTATGKKAYVRIMTCDVSIQSVYGGGNAAAVPETDVFVNGAYEIAEVFGGGNGKDSYTTDDGAHWTNNPGANVNGNATTLLKGGYIHEAYGGSNSKGTISGNVSIDKSSGGACTLQVDDLYGAGKDADIEGDLIMVMGCSETRTENIYGCSKNANVKGNVELTITSGEYGKVFGGNNESGAIFGHIIVNIEEVGCSPIIIDELYGCGNDAAYSTYGYYEDGTNAVGKPNYVARTSMTDHTAVTFEGKPHTVPPYDDPQVNIISCTRIGKVFGGGLGSNAIVYGNPKVNINQIYGKVYSKSNNQITYTTAQTLGVIGDGYTDADSEAVEGGVFGGGNKASVEGNTTLNIGTETTLYVVVPNEVITVGTTNVSSYYTYNEAGYSAATGTAAEGTTYYEKTTENGNDVYTQVAMEENASVSGYYTYNEANYMGASGTAVAGTTYYERTTVQGARITGDVFGGGDLADVTGNTFVNVCAKYNEGTTKYEAVAEGASGVVIGGTVYGGGKGQEDTFTCEKAMIGENNAGANDPDYPNGNTSVRIGHGTVNGSVYGGGKVGRVEMNTVVEIGFGEGKSGTKTPVVVGNVFGAGAGVKTHGYSALVRGNTHVTIEGDTWVKKSVYGGGEIASVARYNVAQSDEEGAPYGVKAGEPYLLANSNSGYCHVKVQGNAEIGTDGMKMYHEDNGSIPDDDQPDDWGHVFAAGKGVLPDTYDFAHFTAANRKNYPKRMALYNAKDYKETDKGTTWEYVDPDHSDTNLNIWEYFNTEAKYFTFIQTLGLATQTDVTIDGTAFVKGSVYGGSENGLVQFDTYVNIDGDCQIGQGEGVDRRYNDTEWTYDGSEASKSLAECAHWEFKEPYAPYDPYAKYLKAADGNYYYDASFNKSAEGGAKIATDGHTYYGNVFGGGSGCIPYFNSLEGVSKYISTAGMVKGDTHVEISGGHILTSVFGGCEATNVLGDAYVTMTDGTIGVPRTLDQIMAHPVTCFLFGAGKGDQRIFFNKETNVRDAIVTITGGKIYGTAFGGGEDGHVLRHVTMTIGEEGKTTGPTIGTLGTSYYDGNVFGGGRGFGGDALTAGNVGGCVDLTIHGGSILGSVYGGGRLASVGYGLYLTTETGYGVLRADNVYDDPSKPPYQAPANAADYFGIKGRGHINVTINGGTIGNDAEYVYNPAASVIAATGSLRNTEFEDYKINETTTIKRLKHTKGGNVFAGSMGRLYKLNGTTPNIVWQDNADPDILWEKLAHAKQTTLTITGGTIKSCVYGGGELGMVDGTSMVSDQYSTTIANNKYATTVNITGGKIGTEIKNDNDVTQYTFGSVFGGGYGSTVEAFKDKDNNAVSNPKLNAGLILGSTHVTMSGGEVLASVYGGGETASIDGSTNVAVSGGTIGKNKVGTTYFGGATMGNVYGGGSGNRDIVRAGHIFGNTNVTISQADNSKPTTIYHNVYGGGAYGTVGDFEYTEEGDPKKVTAINGLKDGTTGGTANVTITGGTIGVDGNENGMVFGSSRGDMGAPNSRDDWEAWVYDTKVTIGTSTDGSNYTKPWIKGSVYGSGENGHTWNDADVKIYSGLIGVTESDALGGADYTYRGNVYGGGCGTDTYTYIENEGTENEKRYQRYNPLAGIVQGSTKVTITGGQVVHNVYGAGAMGSVGTITNFDNLDKQENGSYLYKHVAAKSDGALYNFGLSWPYEFTYGETGKTSVSITDNAIIGVEDSKGGHVYGAAKGNVNVGTNDITEQRYMEAKLANVRETKVVIGTEGKTDTKPTIHGSVYGGGEDGHVYDNASVTIHHGRIDHSIFGGGKGEGTFETKLYDPATEAEKTYPANSKGESVHSWIAGKVFGKTEVIMNGGSVGYNIYGGGNLASVGKGNYAGGADDFMTAGYGELPPANALNLWTGSTTANTYPYYFMNSGTATVTINAGKVGVKADGITHTGVDTDGNPYGNVFGSSRGKAAMNVGQLSPRYLYVPDFFLGYVNQTAVTIGDGTNTPVIFGSVYGGGQDGHVRRDTKVIINKCTIGHTDASHTDALKEKIGNVFGAGSGLGQYIKNEELFYNNSSGSVTCSTTVEVKDGANILGDVYGGGELASVGPPNTGQGDEQKEVTSSSTHQSVSFTKVDIKGGTISGDVYGSSRGGLDLDYNGEDPNTYATNLWSTVNVSKGEIGGSVFGGGEAGQTKCSVDVNITGGTITKDVYGGGALANTNTANPEGITNQYTTTVNLLGGSVNDVYGGGLGQKNGMNGATSDIEAIVYGDVNVNLNGLESADYVEALHKTLVTDVDETDKTYYRATDGCIVTGNVFGCNNYNGTPKGHAKVHVFKTKPKVGQASDGYDVSGVYGGGNAADYVPAETETKQSTEVIIEGCDLTSIENVYGSGYGAASPATSVLVKGTKIIDNVYGGGYGASTAQYTNPGANVGYLSDKTLYGQGTGKAIVQLMAGTINNVYGGSNTKGDIRGGSSVTNVANDGSAGCCDKLSVGEIYGGGKQADMYGGAEIVLGCMPNDWIGAIYAGAENADIGGDVSLTLTSGKFERVFGGNNEGGVIDGSIEVNIEENPNCETPIIIGELYGGGNMASYTVPSKYTATNPNYQSPRVNVRAFTSIGNIYGGGLGENATITGNPLVNINVVEGGREYVGETGDTKKTLSDGTEVVLKKLSDNTEVTLYPRAAAGKMGVIGNVFGGGNAAMVIGNTNVNIGTAEEVPFASLPLVPVLDGQGNPIYETDQNGDKIQVVDANGQRVYESDGVTPVYVVKKQAQVKTVVGADIRGNVYGGGNKAEVRGDTNVVIGKKKE